MNKPILVALLTAAAFTALPAAAQFQKPEDAIKYRQATFTVMAAHFGRVAAMAQGKVPFDAKAAADNVAIAAAMAPLPFTAFGPGTDKGAPTRAKAEAWTDADFKDDAKAMQDAMAKLSSAAQSGDEGQIKAAVGEVGKTCKGCHDEFRAEKYSSN